MMHLKIADKTLLVGDRVSALLMSYAALVGRVVSADSVTIAAIDAFGDAVDATLLLTSGTALVTETTRSSLPEPDDAASEECMRLRLARFDDPSEAGSEVADPFA